MSAIHDTRPAAWTSLLDDAGARRDQDGIARDLGTLPGDAAADMAYACDHLQLLALRGPDAATFLQGQVTADIRDLSQQRSRLAMHLSLKGRALVSFRVLPAEEGLDLLVPATMASALQEKLGKYMVFSKATLTLDTQRVVIGLSGPGASETLSGAGLPLPRDSDAWASNDTISVVRAGHRYLVVAPVEDALDLWPSLTDDHDTGAADHALLADIADGEGHIFPGAEDLFLPQVLNYDLIHGVSFNKGCYTGQEVVARMKFKGQLKQRMRRLQWESDRPLPPGTVLRNNGGQSVGEVVVSVLTRQGVQALAVLRHDAEGPLLVDGLPLGHRPAPLPYALPEDAPAND
ncbi:YgfZ/GcvT domain-containing protein [Isoalcanivorax indicus]|uniref:CAF17-like 4Fe-4S cluster assembly/insertion protein YgfZ n=1 Tax=Isoalcanivorax indicus TaxID=2202653 RepID=UPI000DB9A8EA|nr:folate-binding protein YgfZ [Isoalcanivorax indicus]